MTDAHPQDVDAVTRENQQLRRQVLQLQERLAELSSPSRHATNGRLAQQVAAQHLPGVRPDYGRFRRFVEAVSEGYLFYTLDIHNRVQYLSVSVEHLLGLVPSQVIGSDWRIFADNPNEHVHFMDEVKQRFTGGVLEISHNCTARHADGSERWFEVREFPCYDQSGKLIAIDGIAHDVTRQRQAELAAEQNSQARAVTCERYAHLSNRERSVMRLVVEGAPNKIIASRLQLSIKTIEKHRSSVMRKLGATSVPALVRMALLVESPGASY